MRWIPVPLVLSFFALLACGCGGIAIEPGASSQPGSDAGAADASSVIANPSFALPADGTPNDNGPIGPFCCTGTTATVRAPDGRALGYVYFFDFPGGGVNVGTTSYAQTLGVMISGAQNLDDPSSPQEQSEIYFASTEMKDGLSRSGQAGALLFDVTITHVDLENVAGELGYDMGTIAVGVEVSVAP